MMTKNNCTYVVNFIEASDGLLMGFNECRRSEGGLNYDVDVE